MSDVFVYIATKSTNDPYIARRSMSLDHLSQDVSDAFYSLSGGWTQVGRLAMFPIQRAVPNHLLCDGREVSQVAFPELYAYLGDTQGAAAAGAFKLPDYSAALTPAVAPETETVESGTVSTPPPAVTPPTYYPEQTNRTWGNVDSGGRTPDIP